MCQTPAMRVFLSHAHSDGAVARYLASAFREVGVRAFMLPDDAAVGAPWMDAILEGLRECDEAVSIITSDSVSRPWIGAEWACFWMQKKPVSALLAETRVDQLWEPMRTLQTV